ncbi:RNA polymerase sigma factor [Herbiconiux sp. YIM B11900]|uniref:RNA polymerase sigma factor n=1 Tax=Herbiconiux sp. YIM B11900 TaxID=3404131 RepID=UPI003F846E3B
MVIDREGPLRDAPDAVLVGRASQGDIVAFEVIAHRHGPLMRVVAAKLLSSDAESDDVVQDAFISAWRHLPELDDPARLRHWLMRIVSNRALDRIRSRRPHDDIDDWEPAAPAHRSPDVVVERRLQLDALSEALGRLPADQRRCWLLRETAGYSYQEIADALELPISTVRGLLARSRAFLLHEMEAWR